jgi:hypothetical protein
MSRTIAPEQRTIEQLSEALADVFRTAEVGDVFTDDVLLDGHPPFWRFQLQGLDSFAAWLRGYAVGRPRVGVVRTIPTAEGFVTEHYSEHDEHGQMMSSRKVLVCTVRAGRVSEMTVFCSGDWDAELRARHATESPMVRP